ncbi:MAG: type IV pilin N-terminal domain-containing protein [Nitrososphaerales archaeon]|nr:type IV pilin N-terminal domain-containing protein [Nitrososphaerales archaeon]
MKITSKNERKAISPIIATVLIIAATLIAFAAIGGYVFGIFGSASNTANVQVTSAALGHLLAAGSLTLVNSGTGSTTVSGVSITYNGQTCSVPASATNGWSITGNAGNIVGAAGTAGATGASQTITVTLTNAGGYCGTAAPAAAQGTAYNGNVLLANGALASFTGTFT